MSTVRRLFYYPKCEALESRCLPASLFWNGVVNDDWDTAGNWALANGAAAGRIPTPGDDVTIGIRPAVVRSVEAYAQTITIAINGDLRINEGASLFVGGAVINQGRLAIDKGAQVDVIGDSFERIVRNNGTFFLGGTLGGANVQNSNQGLGAVGGQIIVDSDSARINSHLENKSILRFSSVLARLSLDGLTQTPESSMRVAIAVQNNVEVNSVLTVGGGAILGGSLQIDDGGGAQLWRQQPYTWTVVRYGVSMGNFTEARWGLLTPQYEETSFSLFLGTLARLDIQAPAFVQAGIPFDVTVSLFDQLNAPLTGFTHTISLTSTDSQATLPLSYTFTPEDNGVHTFSGIVLQAEGEQTITASDMESSLSASDVVQVIPPVILWDDDSYSSRLDEVFVAEGRIGSAGKKPAGGNFTFEVDVSRSTAGPFQPGETGDYDWDSGQTYDFRLEYVPGGQATFTVSQPGGAVKTVQHLPADWLPTDNNTLFLRTRSASIGSQLELHDLVLSTPQGTFAIPNGVAAQYPQDRQSLQLLGIDLQQGFTLTGRSTWSFAESGPNVPTQSKLAFQIKVGEWKNAAPAAQDDSAITQSGTAVSIAVLLNDSDPNGDTRYLSRASTPANGRVQIDPAGNLIYTPNEGFSGRETLTYEVTDRYGGRSTATVTIDVLDDAFSGEPFLA